MSKTTATRRKVSSTQTSRNSQSRASLGDSWGEAAYESENSFSFQSGSDSDPGSFFEPTPLPVRTTRASSRTPQDTPVKTPTNRTNLRQSRTSATPQSKSPIGPSFIMPSMRGSYDDFPESSPLSQSNMRSRQSQRRTSARIPNATFRASRRYGTGLPRRVSTISSSEEYSSEEDDQGNGVWVWLFRNLFWPLLSYFVSVFKSVFMALQYPLVALLVVLLCLRAIDYMGQSVLNSLSPVCTIPGSSYLIPFCATVQTRRSGVGSNEPPFKELVGQQSNLEDIVTASCQQLELPADMRLSESSIRDLNTKILYSTIPSKSELGVEMRRFINTARLAADELQNFNSHINKAVDKVISTNRFTAQMLNNIAGKEETKNFVERGYDNTVGKIFSSGPTMEERVFNLYTRHASVIEDEINELIKHGERILGFLKLLDDQIDVIGSIAGRDLVIVTDNHDEILGKIWTQLGGNRAAVKKANGQVTLLKQVEVYRKRARGHVTNTLLKLREIKAGLKDLKEEVAAPGVAGMASNFPLDYYLDLINQGAERLQVARGEVKRRQLGPYADVVMGRAPSKKTELPIQHVTRLG